VIVNGQTVLANGQMTEVRPGVALRGSGYRLTSSKDAASSMK
jgi:hypothetical protein